MLSCKIQRSKPKGIPEQRNWEEAAVALTKALPRQHESFGVLWREIGLGFEKAKRGKPNAYLKNGWHEEHASQKGVYRKHRIENLFVSTYISRFRGSSSFLLHQCIVVIKLLLAKPIGNRARFRRRATDRTRHCYDKHQNFEFHRISLEIKQNDRLNLKATATLL